MSVGEWAVCWLLVQRLALADRATCCNVLSGLSNGNLQKQPPGILLQANCMVDTDQQLHAPWEALLAAHHLSRHKQTSASLALQVRSFDQRHSAASDLGLDNAISHQLTATAPPPASPESQSRLVDASVVVHALATHAASLLQAAGGSSAANTTAVDAFAALSIELQARKAQRLEAALQATCAAVFASVSDAAASIGETSMKQQGWVLALMESGLGRAVVGVAALAANRQEAAAEVGNEEAAADGEGAYGGVGVRNIDGASAALRSLTADGGSRAASSAATASDMAASVVDGLCRELTDHLPHAEHRRALRHAIVAAVALHLAAAWESSTGAMPSTAGGGQAADLDQPPAAPPTPVHLSWHQACSIQGSSSALFAALQAMYSSSAGHRAPPASHVIRRLAAVAAAGTDPCHPTDPLQCEPARGELLALLRQWRPPAGNTLQTMTHPPARHVYWKASMQQRHTSWYLVPKLLRLTTSSACCNTVCCI